MNQIPKISTRRNSRGLFEARATINGKRRSWYSSLSAQDATEKAEEYLREFTGAPPVITPTDQSLGGWLASEFAPLYSQKSKSTIDKARWAILLIIEHLGHVEPEKLTLGRVTGFFDALTNSGYEPNSVRDVRGFLSRALRLLVREGRVKYNFCEEIRIARPAKRADVLTVAQARRLWRINRDEVLGGVLFCGLVLGLSESEAAGITRADLRGGVLHVRGKKNSYRDRKIALSPRIEEILRAYLGSQIYLCRGQDGQPLRHNWSRSMRAALRRAGYSEDATTIHGLRHTFTAIETRCGCPRTVRKAIMGQSTRNEIGDYYVHPSPANMRESLARWEKLLRLDRPECLPSSGVPIGVRLIPTTGVPRAI